MKEAIVGISKGVDLVPKAPPLPPSFSSTACALAVLPFLLGPNVIKDARANNAACDTSVHQRHVIK